MKNSSPRPLFLERYVVTVILGLAVALAILLTLQRLSLESAPAKVELAFPEKNLLQASARDPEAPARLLAAGATTLVRVPYTLDTMLRYGLAEAWHPKPDQLEIRLADDRLLGNAVIYLTGQFGMSAVQIRMRENQYIMDLHLPLPLKVIDPGRFTLEISQGPMPAGFRRALLLPAGDWGQTADLDQYTQSIASLRPELVIPDWRGGIHPGFFYRSYFNTPWLRKPLLTIPEFNLPGIGGSIIRDLATQPVIRCHLISRREATGQTMDRLCRRAVRAVRERRVGLVYFDPPAAWSFDDCLAFFRQVKAALVKAGIQPGPAGSARMQHTGYLAMHVLYWGAACLLFLFIWKGALWAVGFTGREEAVDRQLTIRLKPSYFRWTAFYFGLGLMIIHWQGSANWSAKIASLMIALLAPLLAVMQESERPAPEPKLSRALGSAMLAFLRISATSLAAGLGIAGLLFSPDFVQRLDAFWGVKLAFGLPLFLSVVYFFPSLLDGSWWHERWRKGRRSITFFGLAAALAVILLLLIRSGNTGWLTSATELDLRDHLETWLGARPRFKEFLIGHPLLLLGLAGRRLPSAADKIWPEFCISVGIIGQLSLINSFCHIHTPLGLSLLRSLHGLWMGFLAGLICVLAAWLWSRTRTKGLSA